MQGFAHHHSSGRLAPFLTGRRSLGGVGDLLQIDHPPGDYSRPAFDDLALIVLRSPRLALETDFGAGRASFTAVVGDLFLAPAHLAPRIVAQDAHRLSCLAFPSSRLTVLSDDGQLRHADFGSLHRRAFRSPLLAALVDRIWEHAAFDDPAGRLFADGALSVIAAELTRLAGLRPPAAKGGMSPLQLARAVEALRAGENPAVAEIAREIGMSVPHFNRAFRAAAGTSPHAFRTGSRIETAKLLLRGTRLPITGIATRLGYSEPSYFARRFRLATGMSAGAYRRAGEPDDRPDEDQP